MRRIAKIGFQLSLCALTMAISTVAYAEGRAPGPTEPEATPPAAAPAQNRLGGHLGVAVPMVEFANDTSVVGRNGFLNIANPIGLSLHLNKRWTLDFEFIVVNSVLQKKTTGLIIDPGVVYHAGPFNAGLRIAHQVGEPANIGAIALINRGFEVPFGVWFVELAAPMFVKQSDPSIACVLHTGVGF